jgi:hypothetical protein
MAAIAAPQYSHVLSESECFKQQIINRLAVASRLRPVRTAATAATVGPAGPGVQLAALRLGLLRDILAAAGGALGPRGGGRGRPPGRGP